MALHTISSGIKPKVFMYMKYAVQQSHENWTEPTDHIV